MDSITEELKDTLSSQKFENNVSYKKVYEDNEIVTYKKSITVYEGGAYPSSLSGGESFSKNTGTLLGMNMLNSNKENEIIERIKVGLMNSFEVKTCAELLDYITVNFYNGDCDWTIPLPESGAYIIGDTIVFEYGNYEITSHVGGAPVVKFALQDFNDCLSDEIQKLLKRRDSK